MEPLTAKEATERYKDIFEDEEVLAKSFWHEENYAEPFDLEQRRAYLKRAQDSASFFRNFKI